jgi:hypothetical protein
MRYRKYRQQPGLSGAENENGLKLVTDRNGREVYRGQVAPDSVFDEIAATNQHNSTIINWKKLNGIMARTRYDDNGVYNTASKGSGRYKTVAARERAMVPLYVEISPNTRQVNFQMYDPETMQSNLAKMIRGKKGKELWDSIGPAMDDMRAYMDNLANGRAGETGIGLAKKGALNEAFGINAEANPFVEDLAKRSPSVFKTFRLDRINRITELAGAREPVGSGTYEKVLSFMQPRKAAAAPVEAPTMVAGQDLGNDGHKEAIPATVGNPNALDPVAKIDYRLTESPLLGKSAVDSTADHPPLRRFLRREWMKPKYLNPTEQNTCKHWRATVRRQSWATDR